MNILRVGKVLLFFGFILMLIAIIGYGYHYTYIQSMTGKVTLPAAHRITEYHYQRLKIKSEPIPSHIDYLLAPWLDCSIKLSYYTVPPSNVTFTVFVNGKDEPLAKAVSSKIEYSIELKAGSRYIIELENPYNRKIDVVIHNEIERINVRDFLLLGGILILGGLITIRLQKDEVKENSYRLNMLTSANKVKMIYDYLLINMHKVLIGTGMLLFIIGILFLQPIQWISAISFISGTATLLVGIAIYTEAMKYRSHEGKIGVALIYLSVFFLITAVVLAVYHETAAILEYIGLSYWIHPHAYPDRAVGGLHYSATFNYVPIREELYIYPYSWLAFYLGHIGLPSLIIGLLLKFRYDY